MSKKLPHLKRHSAGQGPAAKGATGAPRAAATKRAAKKTVSKAAAVAERPVSETAAVTERQVRPESAEPAEPDLGHGEAEVTRSEEVEAEPVESAPRSRRGSGAELVVAPDVAGEEGTQVLSLSEHKDTVAAARADEAMEIVLRYTKWSAAGGILPVPVLDIVAVAAVNVQMIDKLAVLYEQPFSQSEGKAIVWSLMGSLGPYAFGLGLGNSLAKILPGSSLFLGLSAMAATSAAATYSMGRLFVQHFDSGGTLLQFDPVAMREYYREQFEAEKERRQGQT